jgi:selenocysteine-specific elongation factor
MDSVVIGTAGHIDHGKSALVHALTGIDPDRLKEEKERGITIDLGFAHYEAGGVTYAFVDVPGHERFVKNMLAGVGGIDLVLLVVAADESVKPQTREHFDICRLLRIPAGVVALTKADLVDADTLELVTLETRELVDGSFLAGAPIVPVSARTGAGLDDLRRELARLATGDAGRRRRPEGPTRLPVDRVFSVKGFGTVVTGTLVAGTIRDEQELVALPAGRVVKARGVQVHGQRTGVAHAGQRSAINLAGVEVADLARGDTLTDPQTLQPTRRFDAIVELLPSAKPLRHGARVRFHQGTSELLGRVAISGTTREGRGGTTLKGRATTSRATTDQATGEAIEPGSDAHVRIRLESAAVITRGDRFILRAYSPPLTIAGGEILDPDPPRGAIRTAAGRRRFERLDPAATSVEETIVAFVEERGAAGLPRTALVARAGLTPSQAAALARRLVGAARVLDAGPVLVAPKVVKDLSDRLAATLTAHHQSQPLSEGIPREEIRERLFGRAHSALFDHVVQDLVARGVLVARDRLALASHQVSLTPEEARAREAVERAFREAALKPPDLASLTPALRLAPAVVDRVVKLLVRQKTLVRVEDLLFHADALSRLKADITSLRQPGAEPARVDVGSFKERFGVTRKYAIPLLEYLDRERVTRRVGDARIVI